MKICIQTGDVVDRLGFEKGYKAIKDAGFEAVDWNIDHAWKGSDIINGTYLGKCIFDKSLEDCIEYYKDELEIIRKNNLVITQAHAPFPAFSKNHPEVLDYAISCYKRCIEYCDYAGVGNLVIHGVPYALDDDINTKEDIHNINMKLYSSLIPELVKSNVKVCLENLFTTYNGVRYQGHCGDIDEAVEDIDYLNGLAGKDVFGFCLDTGHANLLHEDFRVIIPKLGKRISCLHIHDNDGTSDEHKAPCTGKINWNHFCSSLRKIGYDGDLDFETFNQTNIAMNFDIDMVYPWIYLIYKTGEMMRKKITE